MDESKFRTVARVGELAEGTTKAVDVDGTPVALFLDGGTYYALEDSCPHNGAPLSDGLVCDKVVTCTWHGWRFNLADGTWADSPKTRVATYPVRVLDGAIQVAVD